MNVFLMVKIVQTESKGTKEAWFEIYNSGMIRNNVVYLLYAKLCMSLLKGHPPNIPEGSLVDSCP